MDKEDKVTDKVLEKIKRLGSIRKDRSDETVLTDPGIATIHNYNNYERDYPSVSKNSQFPDIPPPNYSASVRAYNYDSYYSPPIKNPPIFVDPIAPITNQPKSNDKPQSQSVKPQKTTATKHPKWDFVNNKHNAGKNWCDNFWWLIISVIIFGMGAYNYRNKEGETLESHSTTTFLFLGGGVQLFMTIIAMWMKCLQEPTCMLVWAIGTILTRLAVCTWGTYILFLEVQSASPTTNSTTTTPRPFADNEGGFTVPIWLLWTVIIIYWLFLFLFCCCRMSQRDRRYTGSTEGECILFSIECCECMVQCCEDLGKGQIMDGNGEAENFCGNDEGCNDCICCDCTGGECTGGECDGDCGNCDCGSCDC